MPNQHAAGPWGYYGGIDVRKIGGAAIARVSLNGNADEVRANGRLIAAAPDLLAALEVTVKRFMDEGYDSTNFEEAIAAIAKAKGL